MSGFGVFINERGLRGLVGVLSGAPLGAAELVFVCAAGPLRAVPAARPMVDRWTRRFVALDRARLRAWSDHETPASDGSLGFLALRGLVGVVAGYLCVASGFLAVLLFGGVIWELARGESDSVPMRMPGVRLVTNTGILGLLAALLAASVLVATVWGAGALERRLADRFLGPGSEELMRRRIAELTATRSGIVRAVDDERRRIERDLHDGVQQRGVSLAMLLGRAAHAADSAKAAELVAQAYGESRQLLDELRSVAWRIYPTALDELGLRAALAGVAERAGVPVTVHYGLSERPVSAVETALYFVAREAITNAVKHSGARDVLVMIDEVGERVSVSVSDDGRGGADVSGGGLSGLARRVEALDGEFRVDSPPGGPTVVTAVLPKGEPCE